MEEQEIKEVSSVVGKLEFHKGYSCKELFEVFNRPYKMGGPLAKFLNQIKSNYEVEKIKNKYFLLREFTKEEKEIIKPKGRYLKLFETTLSFFLSESDTPSVQLSTMELFMLSGMVNHNYKFCKNNIKEVYPLLRTTEQSLSTYFETNYKISSLLLKTMLTNLKNKGLILDSVGFRLCRLEKEDDKIHCVMQQEVPVENNHIYLAIEREGLLSVGAEEFWQLYNNKALYNQFQKKISEAVSKQTNNQFNSMYRTHNLTLNRQGLFHSGENLSRELNMEIKEKFLKLEGQEDIVNYKTIVSQTIDMDALNIQALIEIELRRRDN